MPSDTPATGLSRRAFGKLAVAACASSFLNGARATAEDAAPFQLRYTLASSMYGTLPLKDILPEVKASGATGIDLWPKPHGSQREEVDAMGAEKFVEFVHAQDVKIEMITRYDLGPFRLMDEIALAQKLGVSTIVCGASGPVGLTGDDLKAAVQTFAEKLKPVAALAEEKGVQIAIENHGKTLIETPDSLRWLSENLKSPYLGIAFAPYHLPQESELLASLITDFGPRMLVFYAWQFGMGCVQKQPKPQELLQMPGRGSLDFKPLLAAMKKTNFKGRTEVFMHPVPRGIPILDTAAEVTAEINRGRHYLEETLATT